MVRATRRAGTVRRPPSWTCRCWRPPSWPTDDLDDPRIPQRAVGDAPSRCGTSGRRCRSFGTYACKKIRSAGGDLRDGDPLRRITPVSPMKPSVPLVIAGGAWRRPSRPCQRGADLGVPASECTTRVGSGFARPRRPTRTGRADARWPYPDPRWDPCHQQRCAPACPPRLPLLGWGCQSFQ